MLFFAIDPSHKLVNVGQEHHCSELSCPFCLERVQSLKVVGDTHFRFFHIDKNISCRPSVAEQLHLFFSHIPDSITMKLPAYTHVHPQYSVPYPDYPQKIFTFPEQVYDVPSMSFILDKEDFIRLELSADDILAYHFNYDGNSFIIVMNFLEQTLVIPDFFDELLYYSSTVFEVTMPNQESAIFKDGFTFDSILKNLRGTYLRNEILHAIMKTPQKLLHETYLEWLKQMSMQLKQLEQGGIIKIRS